MKLVWESLNFGNPNAPWTLWRKNGLRFEERLGTLCRVEDGYMVYAATLTLDEDRIYPMPADLTLDEAKSAAKLILATGGNHEL